jgi:hypothetical protein
MDEIMETITTSLGGKKWKRKTLESYPKSSKLFVMQAVSVKLGVKIEIEEFRGSEI